MLGDAEGLPLGAGIEGDAGEGDGVAGALPVLASWLASSEPDGPAPTTITSK